MGLLSHATHEHSCRSQHIPICVNCMHIHDLLFLFTLHLFLYVTSILFLPFNKCFFFLIPRGWEGWDSWVAGGWVAVPEVSRVLMRPTAAHLSSLPGQSSVRQLFARLRRTSVWVIWHHQLLTLLNFFIISAINHVFNKKKNSNCF